MSSLETAPLLPQEIDRLFQQATNNVRANLGGTDEDGRRQALRVARNLVASLENPQDVVMRYVWEVELSHPKFTANPKIRWVPSVWLYG